MSPRRSAAVIRLSFNPTARALLVRFAGTLSRETLASLDGRLSAFVERHGAVDAVFDFSDARVDAIEPMVGRAVAPSRMPGRRRVFVTPNEMMQGVFRLYGVYQQNQGGTAPTIVRSLDEAFAVLDAHGVDFHPIDTSNPVRSS
jgi:hypothetical protein